MSTFLVLCPTHRDHRELALLAGAREHMFLFHDYATTELEEMISPSASPAEVADVEEELERILSKYHRARVDGVLSTDDYPGSALASIVARQLGLPGVAPAVNLLCQHKYLARIAQREALPEVVPEFALLGAQCPAGLRFPAFIKPVKSCFSVGAYRVDDLKHLRTLQPRATLPERFFAPFRVLFEKYAGTAFGDGRVLAEDFLEGQQATVEGYAFAGKIHVIGIVDAVMYPGTLVFQRFEYPSRLPQSVEKRMADAAAKVMQGIGFHHGLFNIEFIYNADRDSVHIIEINPRMASQFADLYEKVDGFNTYTALLDLALGRAPEPKRRQGKYEIAVSHVLRRFQDAQVLKVPSSKDVEKLQSRYPDTRVEILTTAGRRLGQELQEGRSYRYGIVSCGGRDFKEIAQTIEHCLTYLPFAFSDESCGSADTDACRDPVEREAEALTGLPAQDQKTRECHPSFGLRITGANCKGRV